MSLESDEIQRLRADLGQLQKRLGPDGLPLLDAERETLRILQSAMSKRNREITRLRADLGRAVGGIEHALCELGVPGPGYPAPVVAAVKQLRAAIAHIPILTQHPSHPTPTTPGAAGEASEEERG